MSKTNNGKVKFDKRRYKSVDILKVGLESIEFELNYLNDYIKETAASLSKKQKALNEEYENAKKSNSDEIELNLHFMDEFHRTHELFPSFTFNSLLVSQFSFFESRLKMLCDLYAQKKFSNVKLSDLKGSDIEKCKRYIVVVAGLNFTVFEENWKCLTDIQKLRNAIVHHSSVLDINEEKNTIKFIKRDQRIKYFDKVGYFYINDVSFLMDFSKLIIGFFSQLVEKLVLRKVIARNSILAHDNTLWGQEKTEDLLKGVIEIITLIRQNEGSIKESQNSDLQTNIKFSLEAMANNLTKIYAFFCNGKWEIGDGNIIVEQGSKGLVYLNEIYGRITLPEIGEGN